MPEPRCTIVFQAEAFDPALSTYERLIGFNAEIHLVPAPDHEQCEERGECWAPHTKCIFPGRIVAVPSTEDTGGEPLVEIEVLTDDRHEPTCEIRSLAIFSEQTFGGPAIARIEVY